MQLSLKLVVKTKTNILNVPMLDNLFGSQKKYAHVSDIDVTLSYCFKRRISYSQTSKCNAVEPLMLTCPNNVGASLSA